MPADRAHEIERLLLVREIEEFLYHEAALLDDRRFDEWLDLLTDDVRYFMPLRRNVKFGEQAQRENSREGQDVAWFDEGKDTLTRRVRQINTGIHWGEEPLSRTCHLVANVQVVAHSGDELRAVSRFLLYRNRLYDETDILAGKREDTLRRVDGAWKLARRTILLDQSVLLAKNLTFFL
jgi:3-phenylpropionate/cinnamic acid dioxygenase small subunit